MVRDVEDERVVDEPGLLERRHDPRELIIDECNEPPVVRDHPPPGGQAVVLLSIEPVVRILSAVVAFEVL